MYPEAELKKKKKKPYEKFEIAWPLWSCYILLFFLDLGKASLNPFLLLFMDIEDFVTLEDTLDSKRKLVTFISWNYGEKWEEIRNP
jgi:hypothetical protein